MNYEKKYKEALEVAQRFYNNSAAITKKGLEDIFPELAENEGERIIHHGTENIYQVVARIDNQYQLKYGDNYTIQKCADVDRCARLWDIAKDAKDGDVLYTSSTASNEVFIFKELTIEGYIECYCSYDSEDKYREGEYHFIGKPTFMTHPATKEQRDQLEKAMADAGYEWDAEKKELLKIEQKNVIDIPFGAKDSELQEASYHIPEGFHAEIEGSNVIIKKGEQNPAWSEEDEKRLQSCLNTLQAKGIMEVTETINTKWLKSLKDRLK